MKYKVEECSHASCLECGEELSEFGRSDRKFCSSTCKNKYHNKQHHDYRAMHSKVLRILEVNHDILERLVNLGMTSVDRGDLTQMGFNPEFATGYHKVRGHDEFRCFEIKYCISPSRIFKIERVSELVKR